MMWHARKISEIGRVVTGKTPLTSRADYFDGDYLFITPTDLDYAHYYVRAAERTVTEDAKAALPGQFIPENAVMFTCIGATIGKCGISPSECLTNQQINSVVTNEGHDPKFVYYLLCNNVDFIRRLSGGAATPIISKTKFEEVELSVPELRLQRLIADILSSYDDLIENNRRRMELLEEAARQLYREWFVRLRFPGREHTHVIDGAPKRWTKGVVSDFYDTGSGGTPSRKNSDYFLGNIPWVKTQELPNGFITDTEEQITDEALKNSAAKLLPEKTVLIAMYGATVGKLGILAMPATTNQACCAVLPRDSRGSYIHAFLFFRENKDRLVGLSAGSAQNNISQQIIRACEMVMPTKALTDAFVEYLEPVFNQWLNLQGQNQKLRAARDLLLPRLMSGEIAV